MWTTTTITCALYARTTLSTTRAWAWTAANPALTLKKPGLMRWSYDTPPGKLFVLDGKYAWFYTPDDAQVSRAPAKQLDDLRSPLRLLLGHTQLAKELDQLTTAPDGADFIITGVPKGMAQRVHLLTLVVDASGAIQRMKLEETDGATTEFTFSGIEEDIPACLRLHLHPAARRPHRQRAAADIEIRLRCNNGDYIKLCAPVRAEEQPPSEFRRPAPYS